MDIHGSSGNVNGDRCLLTQRRFCNWRYFCKLDFMLCIRHGKQPFLPLIIGLAADTMLFAPCQYALPTVSAFCDPLGPYRQFVLLIQLPKFAHCDLPPFFA